MSELERKPEAQRDRECITRDSGTSERVECPCEQCKELRSMAESFLRDRVPAQTMPDEILDLAQFGLVIKLWGMDAQRQWQTQLFSVLANALTYQEMRKVADAITNA